MFMVKQFKNGGTIVIDKSHKSLYRTPVSCMEYFNAIALTGFDLYDLSIRRLVIILYHL